ncbi:MAG: arginine--tRNA ligase [Clostridiales bacterium]|jgi:arginyl-tRNA synthetase|nr:arginine--tRNA ligase [Clostridiales bacterium]
MDFKREIADCLQKLTNSECDFYSDIEIPREKSFGDFSFPCFKLAKTMRQNPAKIAAELASAEFPPVIKKAEATGAFLNFFLDGAFYSKQTISQILKEGADYGKSDEGNGKTVLIDYSSPNIAKRFHVGHLYSTIIGASLRNIYGFLGYKTVGANFLGDWGTQFGKLIVAYKKWGSLEEINKNGVLEMERLYVKFHEEAKSDPTLEEEARSWQMSVQAGDSEAEKLWSLFKETTLKEYEKQYVRLGTSFDTFRGEKYYNDLSEEVVRILDEHHLLKESDGAQIVDLSDFNNMQPCIIIRKDGGSVYATRDIAAAFDRYRTYNFDLALYVTDVRQSLHFAQWFKIIELLGYDWSKKLQHIPYGLLSLENGALSSREGNVVLLEDILDEAVSIVRDVIEQKNPALENKESVAEQVGVGAIVFSSLYSSRIKDSVYSLDKVLSFEGETGPYAQYTHARTASVLEKGAFNGICEDFSPLDEQAAYSVVKLLSEFGEKVKLAAERCEPFIISRYVISLAQAFNKFYHDNTILASDETVKTARLALAAATKTVLKSALALIGVQAPDKM